MFENFFVTVGSAQYKVIHQGISLTVEKNGSTTEMDNRLQGC